MSAAPSARWAGLVVVLVLLASVTSATVTTADTRAFVEPSDAPEVVQENDTETETPEPTETEATDTPTPTETTTPEPTETTTEATETTETTTTTATTETTAETTETTGGVTELDSCQVIREPGRYELTDDITDSEDDICIHVRASDVVLDGNDNTVSGSGNADSIGILLYNGSVGENTDREDSLSNVTVRNVQVTNWHDGVTVGDMGGIGTQVTLQNVVARDNANVGISLTEVEDAELRDVTASENRLGLYLWEVQGGTATGVTVADNDWVGLYLAQEIHRTEFTDVTATGNGPNGWAAGIYLSTDASDNVLTDVYAANNDGAGIRFSDSSGNTVRDAVSESNGGPGVLGVPANGDRLQNVTIRDNGELAISQQRGSLIADGVHVDSTATLSFDEQPVEVDTVERSELPGDLSGEVVSDRGLNLTGIETQVDVTFPLEGDVGEGSTVELWRYDGNAWVQVENATHDEGANEISGTVTADGIVVPVQRTDGGPPGDGTETATTTMTDTGTSTGTETDTTTGTDAGTTTPTDHSTSTGTAAPTTTHGPGTGTGAPTETGATDTETPSETVTEVAGQTETDGFDPADTTTPGAEDPQDGDSPSGPIPLPPLVVVALVIGLTLYAVPRVERRR